MRELTERTNVEQRTQVSAPLGVFFMLWVAQQLNIDELEKVQAATDSFIDAESNLSWTLIRFRSTVNVGVVSRALPKDAKYILQLDANARVLSCNFNMDQKQAKMMREFLDRYKNPALQHK